MEQIKTFEVEIGAIHDIEGARLRNELVEGVDVVDFSLGNLDKSRYRAAQIQKCMELDGGFVFSKPCPREKRKTQIDRGRVEGVDGLIQFDAERVAGIQRPGCVNQRLGKVVPNAPVADFVGMSQIVAGNSSADSHMIKFVAHGPKTGFDIAQAFPVTQLGEGQHQKLIEARE